MGGWEVADGEPGEIISLHNVRKMRILPAPAGQYFQLFGRKIGEENARQVNV